MKSSAPFFHSFFQGMITVLLAFSVLLSASEAIAGQGGEQLSIKDDNTAVASASQPLQRIHTNELLEKLAASHGKVILVNFFAAFCGPCRKEIPELIQLRKEVSQEDLVIIGIAVDQTYSEAASFVKSMGISDAYPVYYGGQELSRAYRVNAIPFNVVYNRKGRIEASEAGYVPGEEMKQFLLSLIQR